MGSIFRRVILVLAFMAFMMGLLFVVTSNESVEARMHHSPCWHCGGTGRCPSCQGEGRIIIHEPINEDEYPEETWMHCRECYGSGICQTCFGSGLEE